jgi:hypothetical protein
VVIFGSLQAGVIHHVLALPALMVPAMDMWSFPLETTSWALLCSPSHGHRCCTGEVPLCGTGPGHQDSLAEFTASPQVSLACDGQMVNLGSMCMLSGHTEPLPVLGAAQGLHSPHAWLVGAFSRDRIITLGMCNIFPVLCHLSFQLFNLLPGRD